MSAKWKEQALHAVSIRGQILEPVRRAIGAALQLAFSFGEIVMSKLGWRAKIKRKFGKDPLLCERCGTEMVLWKVSAIPGEAVRATNARNGRRSFCALVFFANATTQKPDTGNHHWQAI